jgi:nitronate monooxygenase
MFELLSDMNLPLVCAGGVGSELELKKALEIGYDGVQMGTRFIATEECSTPQDYKDAIVQAKEKDITWTTKLTGVPISVINNNKFKQNNSWIIRYLLKSRFKHRIRVIITGISFWRMRAFSRGKGKSSKDLWSAGKSVESINSIESATVIMEKLGQSIGGE